MCPVSIIWNYVAPRTHTNFLDIYWTIYWTFIGNLFGIYWTCPRYLFWKLSLGIYCTRDLTGESYSPRHTLQSFSDATLCAYHKHKQANMGAYNSTTLQLTPVQPRMTLYVFKVKYQSSHQGRIQDLSKGGTSSHRNYICILLSLIMVIKSIKQ